MPGRSFSSPAYRFGFNGKENDNEVKGITGSQQDYGFRIYDPRLSRFLSVDPWTQKYPELTPYQFASNRPIDGIDLDGGEFMGYIYHAIAEHYGENAMKTTYSLQVLTGVYKNFTPDGLGESVVQGTIDKFKNREACEHTLAVANNPLLGVYDFAKGVVSNVNSAIYERNGEAQVNCLALAISAFTLYKGIPSEMPMIEEPALIEEPILSETPIEVASREFSSLPETGTIDPKAVRFSQNSISEFFKDGGSVDQMITDLKNGKLKSTDIEPIRIVEKDNQIYTLDNRRLYAFQQAGLEIKYQKLDAIPANENFKFTTTNNGASVEVRKGKN